MAISKGSESKETQEFKKYIGIAPVFIESINPDRKAMETLYGRTYDTEPEYVNNYTDESGKNYRSARVSVVLKLDNENIALDLGTEPTYINLNFFLEERPRYNKDKSKVQIIDKYGNTSWATIEEAKAKKVPVDRNGNPLNIDKDYRAAYVGEEDLMHFIKTYLCIPEPTKWEANTRKWVTNTDVKLEDCECRFDSLEKLFKGDFSEVKEALGYQPTNKVKVLLGVKFNDDGKIYQAVYTRRFIRNSSNNYKAWVKDINDMILNAKTTGRTLSTKFEVAPIHEYTVETTQFAPSNEECPSTEDPFELGSTQTEELPWS